MSAPWEDYRRTETASRPEPPRGLDAVVHGWVGSWARRRTVERRLHERAEKVHRAAAACRDLSEEALREALATMQREHRRGKVGEHVRGLALVAETARRVLGLAPHLEQLMGACAVAEDRLAEMATGEGKTLVVGLAAVLAGWRGRPVHVLTANDYLAARDAEWLAPLYARCGLRGGKVTEAMSPAERRHAYGAAITHVTAKEVCADFLRDRLLLGPEADARRRHVRRLLGAGRGSPVMSGLHTAIVDEADNALIDEAGTPLIISRENAGGDLREACLAAGALAAEMQAGRDYTVDSAHHELRFRPAGLARLATEEIKLPGVWSAGHRRIEMVRLALLAREFYHAGKQYVVQEGKIHIVDEFTGRLMPDRTWQQGVHQAIEAREGLEISAPVETLARLSFQRFFRSYHRLAGLSGTAMEAAPELWALYGLPVVRIPTHRPCVRVEEPDAIYPDLETKWQAVVEAVERCRRAGRPVLVGTRSVAASEHLAVLLSARGLPFNLLNAQRHQEEARIVAEAGQPGRITIATNMAGRGTDIVLGPGVEALGGLHVVATERHESRRIDRQLFGRAGRQGNAGSAQAFVSLEDDLWRRFMPEGVRRRVAAVVRARSLGSQRAARALLGWAQRAAEASAEEQRRGLLELDAQLRESLSFADVALGP